MQTMNVSLTPELIKIVKAKVKSGLYGNASEVIREALRRMDEQETDDGLPPGWTAEGLRKALAPGLAGVAARRVAEYSLEGLKKSLNAKSRSKKKGAV
jgi:antitoxin ParD1/3/4